MATPFPLPSQHRYGRSIHPLIHTGRENHQDAMWLRLWQARVTQLYPDERLVPTGLVDGPTIRIAVALQTEAGIPATGMIDEETWDLAWA